MLARNRKTLWLLVLAVVVGLAVFAPARERPAQSSPPAPAVPSSQGAGATAPARPTTQEPTPPRVSSELPERGTLGESKADPFGAQSWQPPPPKVIASVPLPPPPPPMAYRFAGRLLQDGKLQVFVSRGDTPISVKVGDRLDGGYVVQAITTEAIALIYPPSGHRASITIPLITSATSLPPPSNTLLPPSAPGSLPAQAVVNPPASSTQTQRDVSAPGAPAPKPR